MTATGFIGLGTWARRWRRTCCKSGHEGARLRRPERPSGHERTAKRRAAAASAPEAPRRPPSVIVTMLPAGEHVRQVYLGPGRFDRGAGAPG